MNKRRELVLAYTEFLAAFSWDWFVTLTFRGYARRSRANRCFEVWIDGLQVANGTRTFKWFRVAEKGKDGNNLHFHVLIGGLHPETERARWARRWDALAGDAKIDIYDPDQDGDYYMLKTLKADEDFDFETNLDASLIQKWWTGDC